jgi:hypothetical protein
MGVSFSADMPVRYFKMGLQITSAMMMVMAR